MCPTCLWVWWVCVSSSLSSSSFSACSRLTSPRSSDSCQTQHRFTKPSDLPPPESRMLPSPDLRVHGVPVAVRYEAVSGWRQVDGFGNQRSCGNQRICVVLSEELSGQRRRVQGERGQRCRVAVLQWEITLGRECRAFSFCRCLRLCWSTSRLVRRWSCFILFWAVDSRCWRVISGEVGVAPALPAAGLIDRKQSMRSGLKHLKY